MLGIKYHLALMIASEFLGFIIGAIVVGLLWFSGFLRDQIFLVAIIALPVLLTTVGIPRFVFRNIVAARCEQTGCTGRAFAQGSKSIVYVCEKCGLETETNVADGDGRTGTFHNEDRD